MAEKIEASRERNADLLPACIVVASSSELANVIAAKITRWSGGNTSDFAPETSEGSITKPSWPGSICTPNGRSAATVVGDPVGILVLKFLRVANDGPALGPVQQAPPATEVRRSCSE